MEFTQVSENRSIENRGGLILILVAALTLTLLLVWLQSRLQLSKLALIPLVLLGVFLLRRSRRLLPDWVKKNEKIGTVDFQATLLTYSQPSQPIPYEGIQAINFQHNYIQGRQFGSKDLIHNGIAELQLTLQDGAQRTLKFIIETEEQLEHLKSIFKTWYQLGIEIKEFFSNYQVQTLCLEVLADKSYQEIQELKQEIRQEGTQ